MSPYFTRRSRGFTLIELLVVISIIALLVSILLPSLGQARLTARKITDASLLRGLAVGWVAYAQDNRSHLGAVSWADMNWTVSNISNGTNSASAAGDGANWVEGTTAFMPWNLALTVNNYIAPGSLASPCDSGGTMTTNPNYTPFPRFQMSFHSNYNYTAQICNRYYGTSLTTGTYTTGTIANAYEYHPVYKEKFGGNSYYANMYLGTTPTGNAGPGMWRRATFNNIETNGRPSSVMLAGFNGLGYHYWYGVPGYSNGTKQNMSWFSGGITTNGTYGAGLLPALGDNDSSRSSNYLLADGHVVNVPMPPNSLIDNITPSATMTQYYQWLSDRGVDVFANQINNWPTGYLSASPWDGRSGWTYPW